MSGTFCVSWHSVKDRLPDFEDYDWVLVRYELANAYSLPIIAELVDGEWFEHGSKKYKAIDGELIETDCGTPIEINIGVKITHWMRIPD
jgi:hypothetical protein